MAVKIKQAVEAKLALGDLGIFEEAQADTPTFGDFATDWINGYAKLECKPSTVHGYNTFGPVLA